MIEVSENQISVLVEKAAVGAGFDTGTGKWLVVVVIMALKAGKPGLAYASRALTAKPATANLIETPEGWRCTSKACLIAGPILTDLAMADLPIAPAELDVPETLEVILVGPQDTHQSPFKIAKSDWAFCEKLAGKTYVPATEESRLAGAGAGLNDAD